jgi:hypothetical protein
VPTRSPLRSLPFVELDVGNVHGFEASIAVARDTGVTNCVTRPVIRSKVDALPAGLAMSNHPSTWLIPGYRYVQVNGVGKRSAFWLPLFLTDMSGFRSTMMQYAPAGNPLRSYLEEHPAL